MKNRVLVFDVDDVICVHENRDYENAKPMTEVIEKINHLFSLGYYIKLYTARGQNSCDGNLELIIERNEKTLISWLEKHKVKYHELIFGKPLGNWYIDDKAMSLENFMTADFIELKGGSNSKIFKEHNKVIKQAKNSKEQYEWYNKAKKFGFKVPKVHSLVVDTLYMEYLDGVKLCDSLNLKTFDSLFEIIDIMMNIKDENDNISAYCDNLLNHIPNNEIVNNVIKLLMKYENQLKSKNSFCHGDLTLENMILKDDQIYLIDSNYKNDFSSYLLDLAKIRQSLNDYEFIFDLSQNKNSQFRKFFDNSLGEDLYLVKLLEITHWIRMYSYKEDKNKVINMIGRLWKEL